MAGVSHSCTGDSRCSISDGRLVSLVIAALVIASAASVMTGQLAALVIAGAASVMTGQIHW